MSLTELQKYTHISKYAQWLPDKQRRETWKETVDRSRDMMLLKYQDYGIDDEINDAYDAVVRKEILGSQRCLQFGGPAILKKNLRIYNCLYSHVDRLEFFSQYMFALLCGCGFGFSVQKHHVAKLPYLVDTTVPHKIVIDDSIEGWADAIGSIVSSFFANNEWSGKHLTFDYSQIRPKGSQLNYTSGKAPGPEPLKNAIAKIRSVLKDAISSGQQVIKPIQVYDVLMHASDAVLSGGIRRAATSSIFSLDDNEMMTAKVGNWKAFNPQRARSNNSIILIRHETTKEEFESIISKSRQYGEPGFVWADGYEVGYNPCVTEDTVILTNKGLKLVSSLKDAAFVALVDGKEYNATNFFPTGYKEVQTLSFESGRQITVTPDHKILTDGGWKEAQYLSKDDNVIIHNHRRPNIDIDNTSKDFCLGYLIGSFYGDGNIGKNNCQLKWWQNDKEYYRNLALNILKKLEWNNEKHKENTETKSTYSTLHTVELYKYLKTKNGIQNDKKVFSKELLEGSFDYLSGVVAGYFDADGTVIFNEKKGHSLRILSVNLENLQNLQIILNSFGIFSKIYFDRKLEGYYKLPDGNGGLKDYYCNTSHELCITKDSIIEFEKHINILHKDKQKTLKCLTDSYTRGPFKTLFFDKLQSRGPLVNKHVYDCTVDDVHAFDANSIYVHNCFEISMWPYQVVHVEKWNNYVSKYGDKGKITLPPEEIGLKSGIQGCNLSTINGGKIKTVEDYLKAAERAAVLGTLQAGFTDFPYLGEVSEQIFRREALLGVSVAGMMTVPDILLNGDNQQSAAEVVLDTNAKIAKKININLAARACCEKPDGNSGCVLGTSSGIHPHHAKRYIRNVQANKNENVYQHFKSVNPKACETSVWSENNTDDVISFCIEVPDGAKLKNQTPALELLKHVKSTQQNWVKYGKRENLCTIPWMEHNVSNTIHVKDNEWQEVTDFIYDNRAYFACVSLLSVFGDKDYAQAPFTTIYLPSEIERQYGDCSIFVSGLIEKALELYEDDLWKACDCLLGLNGSKIGKAKQQWLDKCKTFADKYMDGNIKRLTYLMKDVYNWKKWTDLKREYKDVDYTQFLEQENNVNHEGESACAGGTCEITRL